MQFKYLASALLLFACNASLDDSAGGAMMTDDGLGPHGQPTTPDEGGSGAAAAGGGSAGGTTTGLTGGTGPSAGGSGGSAMPTGSGGTNTGSGGIGSMGPPKPTCDVVIEDNGVGVGCESTVEDLKVKFFWPPSATNSPTRLGVYLHGDGGGDWDSPYYIEQLAEWAVPHGILIVAPLSPGIHEDGSNRWWVESEITVPKLQVTLKYFVDAYGLTKDTVFYAGVSGGAQFMTAQWLHRAGHEYPGAFAHNCGGTDPSTRYPWAWDSTDDSLRNRFALQFNYGSEDFLASQSEDARADFTALGFDVTALVHPGAEHCAHDIVQPTIDFWETQLN